MGVLPAQRDPQQAQLDITHMATIITIIIHIPRIHHIIRTRIRIPAVVVGTA